MISDKRLKFLRDYDAKSDSTKETQLLASEFLSARDQLLWCKYPEVKPEQEGKYIALKLDGEICIALFDKYNQIWIGNGLGVSVKIIVTHWLPIPPIPE